MGFKERLKGLGKKVRAGADRADRGLDKAIDFYNEKIDKIKEPSVDVGLDQKTMLYLAGFLLLIWMFFKRK